MMRALPRALRRVRALRTWLCERYKYRVCVGLLPDADAEFVDSICATYHQGWYAQTLRSLEILESIVQRRCTCVERDAREARKSFQQVPEGSRRADGTPFKHIIPVLAYLEEIQNAKRAVRAMLEKHPALKALGGREFTKPTKRVVRVRESADLYWNLGMTPEARAARLDIPNASYDVREARAHLRACEAIARAAQNFRDDIKAASMRAAWRARCDEIAKHTAARAERRKVR